MKTTTLRLPDELHEKLRREAFEKETSINKKRYNYERYMYTIWTNILS